VYLDMEEMKNKDYNAARFVSISALIMIVFL